MKGAWVTGPDQVPPPRREEPVECWQCQGHEYRLELGVRELQEADSLQEERGKEGM